MTQLDPYGAFVTLVDRSVRDGPLRGLRVGVKDLIAVEGVPRLCGAAAMVEVTPQPRDATVVARLAEAGARIVATTATHEFGWGVITPATKNPRVAGRIAGGSSGGSAAALAAGLIDGALGTDTAGSIRIPAACCGVVGLKTSEGLLPRDGVQPLAPTLDVVGPLARDVDTLVALLSALAATPIAPATPSPLRVGIIREVDASPIDVEVRAAYERVQDQLRAGAATIAGVSLPTLGQARSATATILAAEEFRIHETTIASFGDLLSANVVRALETSRTITNEMVLQARREVAYFRDALGGVFRSVDVLLLPTLACRLPSAGARFVDVDGTSERVPAALTRLTAVWNGAGVPAGSVPVARDADGAPIAVQVVGRWGEDAAVLGVMKTIEAAVGGPWPPEFDDVSR